MRILTTLGMAAALALVGCTNTSTTANSTTAPKTTNADLEQAVKNQLASDSRTAKVDVSADADKNQVTLSGTVYSEATRTQAVNAAKTARPGVEVVDKIDVKPGEISRSDYTEDMAREARERAKATGDTVGNTIEDAWIHTKISSKLITDKDTPARKINIDVVNGNVTLRGNVDTPEAKQEAGRVAMETDGVKRVTNQLRVRVG
jgi:osmotically-inducible protein OsmY